MWSLVVCCAKYWATQLMKLGSWSTQELASLIEDSPEVQALATSGIADAAAQLHAELECQTTRTDELIQKLRCGARIVRLAHQPNLLPYDQLQAQLLYLSQLSERLNERSDQFVAMVFVVDYDICDDKRIRSSRAFDPTVTGDEIRRFYHEIPKTQRRVPCNLAPPPGAACIERFRRQMLALANEHAADGSFLLQQSGLFRTYRSLADFNLFSWMNLSVQLWKLPVLFVRLSDLQVASERQRLALVDKLWLKTGIVKDQLLWYLCLNCKSRTDRSEACCDYPSYSKITIPKVLVDSLSDYFVWNVSGGTSYLPAYSHLTNTLHISTKAGLPFSYESCWKLTPSTLEQDIMFSTSRREQSRSLLLHGHNSLVGNLISEDSVRQYKGRIEAHLKINWEKV